MEEQQPIDEELARILLAISQMTHTPGWAYLKKYFQIQIDALQTEINQVGLNEMKYSYGDIKKIEMRNLKDLINFPQNFINLNMKPKLESDDPYQD